MVLKGLILKAANNLKKQPPLKFVLVMTGYNFITDLIAIPFLVASHLLGTHISYSPLNPRALYISGITLAPLIETLISQMIPILIVRRFTKKPWVIISISAIVFAIPHCTINIDRFIPAFLGGLLLAFTFLHWSRISVRRAYSMTWAVHFLHNLIILSPLLFCRPYPN